MKDAFAEQCVSKQHEFEWDARNDELIRYLLLILCIPNPPPEPLDLDL